MGSGFCSKIPSSKADQDTDIFAIENSHYQVPRINFLIPYKGAEGKIMMRQRVFANHQRYKYLASELEMSWRDQLHFLSLLNQKKEKRSQEVRVLMAARRKNLTHYYILTISGRELPSEDELDFVDYTATLLQNSNDENFILEFNQVHSSIKIDSSPSRYDFYHSDVFFAPFSEQMARIALLKPQTFAIGKKSLMKQSNFRERIRRFVQSFEVDNEFYSFVESDHFLTLLKTQNYNQTEIQRVPLTRFSFIPGHILGENVRPILARDEQTWRQALYVDSSLITAQYVYSWVFDKEKLLAPLKLSISFPPGCQGLEPSAWKEVFHYVFLCSDKAKLKWWFELLPVQL